jgi:hypothetical protein
VDKLPRDFVPVLSKDYNSLGKEGGNQGILSFSSQFSPKGLLLLIMESERKSIKESVNPK